MGDRALRLEAATSEDMAQMRTIAADAMRAGAIGFSTSRTIGHKTLAGDPIPTLRAAARELTEIALGMADAGHGVQAVISDSGSARTPDLRVGEEGVRKRCT